MITPGYPHRNEIDDIHRHRANSLLKKMQSQGLGEQACKSKTKNKHKSGALQVFNSFNGVGLFCFVVVLSRNGPRICSVMGRRQLEPVAGRVAALESLIIIVIVIAVIIIINSIVVFILFLLSLLLLS